MSSSGIVLPAWWDSRALQLAAESVQVGELEPVFHTFLYGAGNAHRALFTVPLVITSGNDGTHAPGSAHYKNAAVDLRSHDKTPAGQLLFGACLAFLCEIYGLGVFDERATSAPHWHVELASLLSGG